jgi:hypothetical protein
MLGFGYGAWVEGTSDTQIGFASLIRDDGVSMRGGLTTSTYNGSAYSHTWQPPQAGVPPYTHVVTQGPPSRFIAKVSSDWPERPGPGVYRPVSEMLATPGAVGWQNEDGPEWLDRTQCYALGDTGKAFYDAWQAAGHDMDFLRWRDTQWEACDDIELLVEPWVAMTQTGWDNRFTAGTITDVHQDTIHGLQYLYPADALVNVSGVVLNIVISALIRVSVAPPPTVTIPNCPPAVIPALKLMEIPPFTAPGSNSLDQQMGASIWHEATALYRPWRLVFLTPTGVEIPLRQSRRTDGLVGAGRQQRPILRQGRVSGPATITGGA